MITLKDNEFERIQIFVKSNFGIDLTGKKLLIEARLNSLLQEKNIDNFSEYYSFLTNDHTGDALVQFLNRITTNHTYFLREEKHFYYLRDTILPTISKNMKSKDFRIWSAGCSSGEEPYTLAMFIDDFCRKEKPDLSTQILATDISAQVLQKASSGIYKNEQLVTLPNGWQQSYFRGIDSENSIIAEKLKDKIDFRKFNLMEKKFIFDKKFHIIFCRNVMIYFDNATKIDLINRFFESTEDGGFLFIGHSETLDREKTTYKYVKPAIYQKI